MLRWKSFLRAGLPILLCLVTTAALLFVYRDTRSAVSIALFKVGYSLTPDAETYLHFYSPKRRDVSGGYLPPEVDEFLCEKAENTQDDHELNAIVHLYALQAEGGREGSCIYRTSDRTREKIAAYLVDHLEGEGIEQYRKIILLEEVRLGETLGKGEIVPSRLEMERPSSEDEWKTWMEGVALPFARQRYVEWWHSSPNWADKKTINPLDGTRVDVKACCG